MHSERERVGVLAAEEDAPGFAVSRDANTGLAGEDLRAFTRLLRRTLGKGFRLVVVEVDTPRLGQQLVAWAKALLDKLGGALRELDIAELPRHNLWSELVEHVGEHAPAERQVLVLRGFEELGADEPGGQAEVYRQLNVQRELFVRDLGCFWVILLHPHASRQLQALAPDFCDFVSLWGRAREEQITQVQVGAHASVQPALLDPALSDVESSPLLVSAWTALVAGRYAEATDALARFELSKGSEDAFEGAALRLRSRLAYEQGRPLEAEDYAQRALAWEREHAGPGEPASLLQLAAVREALGDLTGARAHLERALELVSERRESEQLSVAALLHSLGGVLKAQGELGAARDCFERALAIGEQQAGDEAHPDLAVLSQSLGGVLKAQGELGAASKELERALAIQARTLGTEEHPDVARSLHLLGGVRLAQGELEAARRSFERSIAILEQAYGSQAHPNIVASLHELGRVLLAQGQLEAARQHLERARSGWAEVFGTENHPSVAATLHELGRVLYAQGERGAARQHLERCLAIWVQVFGTENHPSVAATLHELALLLDAGGDTPAAIAHLRRALAIERACFGSLDHYSAAETETTLGVLLLNTGEAEEGFELLRHARRVLARDVPNHPLLAQLAKVLDRR